jgi:hypothetical protein
MIFSNADNANSMGLNLKDTIYNIRIYKKYIICIYIKYNILHTIR